MTRFAGLALALFLLVPAATASAQADSAYLGLVGRGLAASAAGDRGGAVVAFREAVTHEPTRPEAVCHLAEAQRVIGDLGAALEGYRACARTARAANDARWTARALHGLASTFERMPDGLLEARTAWQEYVRFADGAASVASAAVGRSRITSIDQVLELERVMVEVRQRIAERERQRGR